MIELGNYACLSLGPSEQKRANSSSSTVGIQWILSKTERIRNSNVAIILTPGEANYQK